MLAVGRDAREWDDPEEPEEFEEWDDSDELELDEDVDEDELLLLELEECELELLEEPDEDDEELDEPVELEDVGGAELDEDPGDVGEPAPQASNMPTPARAMPPERIRRNSRRSSRFRASFGSLDFLSRIGTPSFGKRSGRAGQPVLVLGDSFRDADDRVVAHFPQGAPVVVALDRRGSRPGA